MPSVRKLEAQEVEKITNKGESQRAQIAREYDGYLADFSPEDYGEAAVDENESKLTVKNRLQAAAGRRGLTLNFMRTVGPVVRFKVEAQDSNQTTDEAAPLTEVAAEVLPTDGLPEESPPRPKRGRPKKQ